MMVDHETGRDTEIIEKQHLDYVVNLPPKTQKLVEQRLTIGRGSWDALEQSLPGDRKDEIEQLRTYEAIHCVDLGYYLRRIREKDKNSQNL
jgi:hypothetical protein